MTRLVLLCSAAAICYIPQETLAQASAPQQQTSPAAGEAAKPDDGADIVVTAQRREQSVQDVGIAMSAFSGEQMKALGVTVSTDLARITPGVAVSATGGGQNAQFSVRGVTQNDFNDAIEAPVAVYVDDTYIPSQGGQIFGTFDLDRVEILKGPQGTLFGRNATGGLVHFVPRKPTDIANGYLDVRYGSYNQARVEGAIGTPVGEKVDVRISGLYNRFDPILKNVYPTGVNLAGLPNGGTPPVTPGGQGLGNDDTLAGRAQIRARLSDAVTVRLTGSAARTNFSTNPYNSIATIAVFDGQGRQVDTEFASPTETRIAIGPGGANVDNTGVATTTRRPVAGGDQFGFVAPNGKSLQVSQDWALRKLNYLKAYDVGFHLDWDLGGVQLAAISNYRVFQKLNGTDVDASPVNLVNFMSKARTNSFSQELRLSGGDKAFEWVAGAYYLNIRTAALSSFLAPRNSIFAGLFGSGPAGIDLVNDFTLKTESISAFGQASWEFAPRLTLIVGGRLINEHQRYDFKSNAFANRDDYDIDSGPALFQLQPSFDNKRSKTLWAGKVQLEYRPATGTLLYAGINRGVKGGGYNAKLPDGSAPLTPAQIPYRPEVLVSYEAGFKTSLFDRHLTLNGGAFYYDYSDYQAFTFANVSGTVANNDARIYGAELSATVTPAEGLRAMFGASLLNATVKQLPLAPGVLRDVKPSFTPSTQLSAVLSYQVPLDVAGGALSFSADGSWRSRQYANIRNFKADAIDPYFLANAHVTWTNAAGNLDITGSLDNIFDKRYYSTSFNLASLCGCSEVAYGRPQWASLSLRYSY